MLISVIIPSCQQKYLKYTLGSLSLQQGISKSDFEVIVVDNPESKSTQEVCSEFGVRYLTSELGSNLARNTGIAAAQSKLIALTDDDCSVDPFWLSRLIGLHGVFRAGCIAGPLYLNYMESKPEWLVDDLEYLLSYVHWKEPEGITGPFDLKHYKNSWVVSANLSFTKENWERVGGFNPNIGYHGRSEFISNDEIQFVNKLRNLGSPGILYDNELIVKHLIPEFRTTLEFLEKKSYGQGYADGILAREENKGSLEDIYHDFVQDKMMNLFGYHSILKTRQKLCNEQTTRLYIKAYIKVKIAYIQGLESALNG